MRGVILAWLAGEGIIIYRSVAKNHAPPVPGALLATSGLFVMLALLGEAAPQLATLLGAGVDIAAFMNLEVAGISLGGTTKATIETAGAPTAPSTQIA
jgi:hypothetical protein